MATGRNIIGCDAFTWSVASQSNAFFIPAGVTGELLFIFGHRENAVWTLKRYTARPRPDWTQAQAELLPAATTLWEIVYDPHAITPTVISTLGQGSGSTNMTLALARFLAPGWYRWSSAGAGPAGASACFVVYSGSDTGGATR